jgi:hypothetical protein
MTECISAEASGGKSIGGTRKESKATGFKVRFHACQNYFVMQSLSHGNELGC